MENESRSNYKHGKSNIQRPFIRFREQKESKRGKKIKKGLNAK